MWTWKPNDEVFYKFFIAIIHKNYQSGFVDQNHLVNNRFFHELEYSIEFLSTWEVERAQKNRNSWSRRSWPETLSIICISFKHGLICNSKQHYAMFKITKCENCVVCLQFAVIATSRLKPDKVFKAIFAWIKVVPVLHFYVSRNSNLSAYCIQNGHILTD